MSATAESPGKTAAWDGPAIPLVGSLLALSAVAGIIHLAVVPEHWEEFRPFGAAFVAMAVFQIGWAATMARAVSRTGLLVGLAVNAGLIAIWGISRTTGLPIGPDHVESVGTLDSLATGAEMAIVLGAGFLLTKRSKWRLATANSTLARAER